MAIGSIIGFLAVFTSFIALAVDMKACSGMIIKSIVFRLAFSRCSARRFFIFIFYFKNVDSLVNILAIIGSVGMGILGIFVVLMRHKIVKILKAGDKDDVVAEIDSREIKIKKKNWK